MMPTNSRRRTAGLLFLTLVLPVLWLFHRSLAPQFALFSNDGPLGAMVSQAGTVLHTFTGLWRPLNWLGGQDISSQPDLTMSFFIGLGSPVLFSKFYAPLALCLLGVAGWFFCRRAGFHPFVGLLVAPAAALNSNVFSYACWGLPPKALALACTLFALGLLLDGFQAGRARWLRVLLAGFCLGMNVIEGADVGAILSLYVAAFAAWQIFAEPGGLPKNFLRGASQLVLVAICAAWIAMHALSALVGTQIKGVSGMTQTKESQEKRWAFATGWSLPKAETLRIIVPGLYGYRMDTSAGGAYWGAVGPSGTPEGRFSGDGQYAGIGVVLIATFALVTSCRREKTPFTPRERRHVWFWSAVALISLLLAYGKFAPFYQFIFPLPFFSTIRIPMKFLHGMDLALWILFAYGLEALARTGLAKDRTVRASWGEQIRAWRKTAPGGERLWVIGSLLVLGLAVVAAVVYMGRAPQLTRFLSTLPPGGSEPPTAEFSIMEVWLAVGFLAATVAIVALAVTGCFGGSKAVRAWGLLGIIVVVDLVRANTPWVIHYDYQMRYQTDAVLDVLRQQPYEHRVTAHLSPQRNGVLVPANEFALLQKEWLENQFQYFNIQSLDIDQMPRTPELDAAYMKALDLATEEQPVAFQSLMVALTYGPMLAQLPPQMVSQVNAATPGAKAAAPVLKRLWQLTNTRYLIASPKSAELFNDFLDPVRRSFKVVMPFTLALKPGAPQPTDKSSPADVMQLLKAVPSEQGTLALIEFGGALPRAKLYSAWQTVTNDASTLERLRSPEFDPERSVLLAEEPASLKPSPETAPGEATIASYEPKHVVLKTKSAAAGVLLLNDRWHADWQVTVDGQPSALLRANFIMRGVAVPAGEHTVEFRFNPPHGTLWVSLSAIAAGLACIGLLAFGSREKPATA